jgi:hypothetical protein
VLLRIAITSTMVVLGYVALIPYLDAAPPQSPNGPQPPSESLSVDSPDPVSVESQIW